MSYEQADGILDVLTIFTPAYNASEVMKIPLCISKATAARQDLLDIADDAAAYWNEEKTVISAEMALGIFDWGFAMLREAAAGIERQRQQNVAGKDVLRALQLKIYDQMDDGRELILKPTQAAIAGGIGQVSSTVIRQWGLNAIEAAANAAEGVTFSQCSQPVWVKALETIIFAANKVKAFFIAVGKFVYDAAKTIADLPSKAMAAFKTILTVLTVAAGGYIGYRIYDGHRRKGR